MSVALPRSSRRRMPVLVLAALVLAAGGGFARQEPSADRLNGEFLASLGRDFAAVLTSPLRWDGRDLGRFALLSAATLGLAAADESIRDWALERRTEGSGDVSAVFEKAGDGAYLLGMAAALYAAGEVWDSRGLRRTGLLSIESLAIASAIGAVMKVAIGRARPYVGEGSSSFHPFSPKSGYHAFPSGHAAAAFAVATTIARQTRGAAVDILAYGAATLVGLSRIHDDQHWSSSVLAGAALGHFVAAKISDRHQRGSKPGPVKLGLQFGPRRQALALTVAF